METRANSYLKPLGTLQLIAVIAVVVGHYGIPDSTFMNSHWASFCFVYSGFFTALRHDFGPQYGLKDHACFMWGKLAKLYPLHLLALALVVFDMWFVLGITTSKTKELLAQATMIAPWIPDPAYYFAFNPVAWYCCALFFLYLMAPLVVRLLRRLPVTWQVCLIIGLLALEFAGGYTPADGSREALIDRYHLYMFPPIRLLDFATGIIIHNISRHGCWNRIKGGLSTPAATTVEASGIALFALLFFLEKTFLSDHYYRAFCIQFPSVVTLLMTFLLTSGHGGWFSRAMSLKPVTMLHKLAPELYLLQYGVYFLVERTLVHIEPQRYASKEFALYFFILLASSWLVHCCYVAPVRKWMLRKQKTA